MNISMLKTKNLFGILILFLSALSLTSCNKDEEGFSKEEIQQMLFDMKGTYHGTVQVDYYHGASITELQNAIAVSRDSLKFNMSLLPYVELISDEGLSERLREIGEVEVVAGYDFHQSDGRNINFGLRPKDVDVSGGYGALSSIRIVFAQTFGGDAEVGNNFIMFNISPLELWVNGKKYEDFPRLVYHFRGNYE